MITLYGITRSRAARCLWMLEELGLPYERNLVSQRDGSNKSPEYLAINPNGKLPALEDGDTVLFESLAINLYLADKYGKALWPESPENRALCFQWSLWVVNEMEDDLLQVLFHTVLLPEEQRLEDKVAQGTESVQKPLGVLDDILKNRAYLLGDDFSVADLNVASVLSWAIFARMPLDAYPKVDDWLTRCLGRPAQQKVFAERAAE